MQDFSSLGVELAKALSPVVVALVSWGALKLSQLIQARVKNEFAQALLLRLDTAAEHAVKEVEQTFVSNLDDAAPAESYAKAKELAVESLKKMLGPQGLSDLAKVLGAGDNTAAVVAALSTVIESKVHDLKLSKKAA